MDTRTRRAAILEELKIFTVLALILLAVVVAVACVTILPMYLVFTYG